MERAAVVMGASSGIGRIDVVITVCWLLALRPIDQVKDVALERPLA